MLATPMHRTRSAAPLANDLSGIRPANASFLGSSHQLLIDGIGQPAASGETFEVRDPSSDQVIANVASGDKSDVDRAVLSARRAFGDSEWSRMNRLTGTESGAQSYFPGLRENRLSPRSNSALFILLNPPLE